MIETYRRLQRQRAAGEIDGGFTLIELLIVIVVLGILAAIVVFALGNVTGKSAAAACQSDAKTVGVGAAALMAENPTYATSGLSTDVISAANALTTTGTWHKAMVTTGAVTGLTTLTGNPFVQTWPNSPSYMILVSDGTFATVNDASATTQTAVGGLTPAYGDILVKGTGTGAKSYYYDATQNPIEACNWAVTGNF